MMTFLEWRQLVEVDVGEFDSDDFLYYTGDISKPSNKPAKFAMVHGLFYVNKSFLQNLRFSKLDAQDWVSRDGARAYSEYSKFVKQAFGEPVFRLVDRDLHNKLQDMIKQAKAQEIHIQQGHPSTKTTAIKPKDGDVVANFDSRYQANSREPINGKLKEKTGLWYVVYPDGTQEMLQSVDHADRLHYNATTKTWEFR